LRSVFVAAGLLAAVGCAQSSVSSPTPPPVTLTGAWTGPFSAQGQTAQMTWTLTQTNLSVSGPALIILPDGLVLANGVVGGSFADPTLTFTVTIGPNAIPTQPTCTGQLTGTAVSTFAAAATLTASYAVASNSCTIPFTGGTFTLTRQ
jgi:hypothetical protein